MRKSRAFIFVLVVLLPFMAGCASSGMKKPTVFVDKPNSIPADIPSQFLNRYEHFVTGKERKEFKKLLTDEERQVFIDKFWAARDPDPTTPENEYKQEIDERIDDIADERFFGTPGTTGLLFRSNGGFRGDMARVYLLHGEPDALDILEGHSFVPLMLWIYGDSGSNRILYAFLFYQKSALGSYRMFSQDSYQMDWCGAIYEVASTRTYTYTRPGGGQGCSDDIYQVYNEILRSSGKGGILDGYVFAWALFNFSTGLDSKQGKALEPPKPASEIAKQSKSRVIGEAPELVGTAGTDYILASCEKCNSMIPAELSLGESFTISAPWKNFDWTVKGEYLELSLKSRVILQDRNGGKPIVLECVAGRGINKKLSEDNPDAVITVHILDPLQVSTIPPGTYQVSFYVKNMTTNKYNAWSKEFTK